MRAPSPVDARQADPVASEPTPIDPYSDSPIRVALAPDAPTVVDPGHPPRAIEAGQGGVRVAEAPASTAYPPNSSAKLSAPHAVARPAGIRVAQATASAPSAAV